MKQAAVRFLVCLALLAIVFAVFGAPTPGPLSSQLGSGAETRLCVGYWELPDDAPRPENLSGRPKKGAA
jgi:hypothetical protein